jgi:hypothetical protein
VEATGRAYRVFRTGDEYIQDSTEREVEIDEHENS